MNGGKIKIRPEFYGPEPRITIHVLNTKCLTPNPQAIAGTETHCYSE